MFDPASKRETDNPREERMKIAVCGAGAAGSYAVKRLRLNLPEAVILLFDAAPVGFYAKMRLPEYLAGTLPREKLILSSPEQMADWGVELHLGEPVTSIDPASHTLATVAGEYSWDILVLAVGAHAFVPPVPGLAASSRVHVLRELPDADTLVSLCEPGLDAAVIGGGLLGLEAAWSLHKRGLAVSVIEAAPRLLPLQMNEEESAVLLSNFTKAGFKVFTGASVDRFEEASARLLLKDGPAVPASLVLVSAGIRANLELAKNAGLNCNRGIVVDAALKTSAPDVYAIGDCAELNGTVTGLWLASKDQGEAVADIIAGKIPAMPPKVYRPKPKLPAF
jgi:nitrite reductase (NADH) large subunit